VVVLYATIHDSYSEQPSLEAAFVCFEAERKQARLGAANFAGIDFIQDTQACADGANRLHKTHAHASGFHDVISKYLDGKNLTEVVSVESFG
jgi:hypothetical protein